jgi:AcrR family transcriptional regulator
MDQRRIARRRDRHDQLIAAAITVFSRKGVSATSVDDIVQAAGVAKGTFYLYFATKDDVTAAVAAQMIKGVADRIEREASEPGRSPVARLGAIAAGFRGIGDESYERDLIEIIHRPENRVLHDRMSEQAFVRLTPLIREVIAEGVRDGMFRAQDPRHAAAYVMACFGSIHDVIDEPADLPDAIEGLNTFVFRGLGYDGPLPS